MARDREAIERAKQLEKVKKTAVKVARRHMKRQLAERKRAQRAARKVEKDHKNEAKRVRREAKMNARLQGKKR